ncbi:hypothetical protein DDT56_16135 [Brenneria corticis]|uniref:Uncharacterized protein n=1 Tax=Brenneria corticis TaxID=2173106 RepID=A0A2U1TU88_9GAMM|nr:GpE family phage tail protein [Brenneria sp. CFCC 11842]PWC12960.1 hypothetical protein DDT56_16135 [Brenneria sp. CFCC 11842]
MRRVPDGFFNSRETEGWRQLAADVAYCFHWEPHVTWGMSHSLLKWWADQGKRINKVRAGNG